MTRAAAQEARADRRDRELEAKDLESPKVDDSTVSPHPRLATDYVHATHPDTGTPVVFVPGEALPSWALAEAPAE